MPSGEVTERDVAEALLGSWPNQVASWGREAIAAYCNELRARDITPAQALVAIRACPADQKFPPSAPELAGMARQEQMDVPTFEEALNQIYGRGGIVRARPPRGAVFDTLADQARAQRDARLEACTRAHPLVGSFAATYGVDQLHLLPINDPEYGPIRRRELQDAWERHVQTMGRRERIQIASGDERRGLRRFDPSSALPPHPASLPEGAQQ